MAIGRRALVAAAAFVLINAGAAGGQTPTTSTTSSSSTSSTSTTTIVATDGPCFFRECVPNPPDAFVSVASGEVKANTGGSCWARPDSNGILGTKLCTAIVFVEPSTALVVQQGEQVSVRFTMRDAPTTAILRRDPFGASVEVPVALGNPSTFKADFPVGPVLLAISTTWLQGDASHIFKLDVRAPTGPAPPTPGVVRFTG